MGLGLRSINLEKEGALRKNNLSMIARYFGTEEKPLRAEEFAEFWLSLTVEEQMYYRSVNLGVGTGTLVLEDGMYF